VATEHLPVNVETADLREILWVIEGAVVVPTDDRAEASVAFWGFRYLLALEFARQFPALALLYDIDVQLLSVEQGSTRFNFKALIKLKNRVKAEIKKAGVIATISVVLALPGAIGDTIDLKEKLFPPTQTELQSNQPHCPPTIEIYDVRTADGRETPPQSGSFEL